MSDEISNDNTIKIHIGGVHHDMSDAAIPLEELMDELQSALDEGAEYIVIRSSNHRGPKWESIDADWDWVD